jgi:hypothetical protein
MAGGIRFLFEREAILSRHLQEEKMDGDKRMLLAACGLYCGACYHYRASFYESERLQAEATRRGREPGRFTCQGCRSDALYIHAGCGQCKIKACADSRGITHCGLCADLPCERLSAFRNDGRIHHEYILIELVNLRQEGPEKWLAA